jgi:exonuclease VII small subunit
MIKDQLVAHQFETPENISSYIDQAGLSDQGSLYLRTSLPRVVPAYEFDRYCTRNEPGIGVLGCYTTRDSRIYLYDVTDPRLESIEPVVAAHEMLHAVWFRKTTEERNALAPLLEEAYAALGPDHPLIERMASYEADNPASRLPELYSIIGTEIREIPEALEAHYAEYFANRALVVDLADRVYRVFDTLQAELEQLSNELSSRNAEIEGLRFTYEETSRVLAGDIVAFNEKASTPGAFPSKSQFEATRAELVTRQERLESMRITLQTKITEYNERLEELNTLHDEVSELNQGINVTLEEEEELTPPSTDIES